MTNQEKNRAQIVAVSVDSHADSKKFIEKLQERYKGDLDFPLLEDAEHRVINRYGILNPDSKGWPHPATYLIDSKGIVRWRFVETNFRLRPSNQQVLDELRKLP